MRTTSTVSFALAVGIVAGCAGSNTDDATRTIEVARLSGAIFTTLVDGTRVDANIYQSKDDVYLDGGPGPGAPQMSAGLPDGNYYFMVTDPSGKTLLSQDAIECREVVVEDGVISAVVVSGCQHLTGDDEDHDAITVQLMPYDDTPNPGGEYKVWMTPVDEYDVSERNANFGFISSESKTDNYKVREPEVAPPPPPPYCGDGNVDEGEQCDDGNNVDGDGCSAECCIEPPPPPPPYCGDGNVDEGEQCDDGNTYDGDGCSSTCCVEETPPPPPVCGDGNLDDGEACDDGNTYGGDGCDAYCQCEVQ
jgi:cysteine-rich repeat protein